MKKLGILVGFMFALALSSCGTSSMDVGGSSSSSSYNEGSSSGYSGSTSGSSSEGTFYKVAFCNYDNTVLFVDEVEEGGTAAYEGSEPWRPKDGGTQYTFVGWDKGLSNVTSSFTTTALYDRSTYYTITFRNYDHEILSRVEAKEGSTAVYDGATPIREGEDHLRYDFIGWDKPLTNVLSSFSVIAQYEAVVYYSVIYLDYDETKLAEITVDKGKGAVYPLSTPTREDSETKRFAFSSWDKAEELASVSKDITTKAVYTSVNIYTVSFYDGATLLKSEVVEEGKDATAPSDPTKAEAEKKEGYRYEFKGWDKEFTAVTGNLTIYAIFDEIKTCKITFMGPLGDYSKFEVISSVTVDQGQPVIYQGTEPFATNDDRSEYAFTGWDKDLDNGFTEFEVTVTAVFSIVKYKYVQYYSDKDKTSLLYSEKYIVGESVPEYPYDMPSKDLTTSTYSKFLEWTPFESSNEYGDLWYYPTYAEYLKSCVTFYNSDEAKTELAMIYVIPGEEAVYPLPTNPTLPDKEDSYFVFTGWSKDLTDINKLIIDVYAVYEEKPYYTVSFVDYDGSALYTASKLKEGDTATYVGSTPSRESSDETVYTFKGWDHDLSNVTSSFTAKAEYTTTARYLCTFQNYDGTTLYETRVLDGEDAVYVGDTPTRPDASIYYVFKGWDKSLSSIHENTVFTAVFEEDTRVITIHAKKWGNPLNNYVHVKFSSSCYAEIQSYEVYDEDGNGFFDASIRYNPNEYDFAYVSVYESTPNGNSAFEERWHKATLGDELYYAYGKWYTSKPLLLEEKSCFKYSTNWDRDYNADTSVTVKGVILDYYDNPYNGVYISDSTGGLLVYGLSSLPTGASRGSYVSVSGKMKLFNGIYELASPTMTLLSEKAPDYVDYIPAEQTAISYYDMGTRIKGQLTIESISTGTNFLTLSCTIKTYPDFGQTMNFIVNASRMASFWTESRLATLVAGDTVYDFTGFVSEYNGDMQIVMPYITVAS